MDDSPICVAVSPDYLHCVGQKMSQRISGFLFLSSYLFHDSPNFKNLKTANLAYFKNMSHQIMLLSHILVEMNGLQTYVAPGASKSF